MCGHGSIGLSSAMVNLGMVPVTEPVTEVKLDTPAGLVTLSVDVKNGEAVSATLKNVPAFVFAMDLDLYLPSIGKTVKFDICFGGSFFAILKAEDFGFEIVPSEAAAITKMGLEVMEEQTNAGQLIPENKQDPYRQFVSKRAAQGTASARRKSSDRSRCGTGMR